MAGFELLIDTLECNKTTEAGADEVYIIVAARKSSGQTYIARLPGEGRHWDMNDGNQPTDNPSGDSHRITNKSIFMSDVAPGESWDVVITILEEDGGSSQTTQQIGAAILASSGNPYAVAAGTLLTILTELGVYVHDTDDYIGSFSAHVSNDGGQVNVAFRPIDRCFGQYPYHGNGHEYDFNGDGSSYKCWFYMR